MIYIRKILLITTLFLLLFACKKTDTNTDVDIHEKKNYRNPIIQASVPDPTIIKTETNDFYLYGTEDIRNVPIFKSKNLVDWSFVGTAFNEENRPNFEPEGGIWAPDINYINGRYVMYYSMSVWGGEWTCGIGIATAEKPEGPFTDNGKLFRSNEIDVQNSIDPFYIEDNGRKYLFWGSFRGIYAIELSDDGLAVKQGAEKTQIAGTAFEGTYIYKRNNDYYFFASIGSCCEGLNSTYTTVIGRADNLFGPYMNKQGELMIDNKYEILIGKSAAFVGVGHNSEIVQDNNGLDWILYHGVSVSQPNGRCLLLDKVDWVNDWPYVLNGTPSTEASIPVF